MVVTQSSTALQIDSPANRGRSEDDPLDFSARYCLINAKNATGYLQFLYDLEDCGDESVRNMNTLAVIGMVLSAR